MGPEQQSKIVTWLKQIMIGFGAGWVMWLLLVLSVISLAIILERAWFFHSLSDDFEALARDLHNALDVSFDSAKKRLGASPSAEAAVVLAGVEVSDKGAASAEKAMEGAAALQRVKLESRLAYLATLGNNAPFIGLFGTVIGVIGAFNALDQEKAATVAEGVAQIGNRQVMSSIAEALVATAVGIIIAIPAVAANNYFQRRIKAILANTEALTKVLLAHLSAVPAVAAAGAGGDVVDEVSGDDTEEREASDQPEKKVAAKAKRKG